MEREIIVNKEYGNYEVNHDDGQNTKRLCHTIQEVYDNTARHVTFQFR